MLRRILVAVAAVTFVAAPTAARAQGNVIGDSVNVSASLAIALAQPAADASPVQLTHLPSVMRRDAPHVGGSALLSSLYVTTALMQGLDVHSTYRAIGRGAAEANPLLGGLTDHRAAFVATKAAMAAVTILTARHAAKHNRLNAIVTLAALNSVYAVVVDHNYRVARSIGR